MNEKIEENIKIRDALLLLQRIEEKSERLEQLAAKTENKTPLNATDQLFLKKLFRLKEGEELSERGL